MTLVEVLLSIAILLLVMGVITPVLLAAKDSAKHAHDNDIMRKIGQAAQIYRDSNSFELRSAFELVEGNVLNRDLLSGLGDKTREGWANIVMAEREALKLSDKSVYARPYRISFIGMREAGAPRRTLLTGEEGTTGWLVNISMSEPRYESSSRSFLDRRGHYFRLLDSGSVVRRSFLMEQILRNGKAAECTSSNWLYADFSQQARVAQCNEMIKP